MILIFQILFSFFYLSAIFNVFKKGREGLLGPKGTIFWFLFWSVATIVVWWPTSTNVLAKFLGIGRGADLVIYVSLATIFYLLFKLNMKLEGLARGVTKLVRQQALEETDTKK